MDRKEALIMLAVVFEITMTHVWTFLAWAAAAIGLVALVCGLVYLLVSAILFEVFSGFWRR